MLVLKTSKVGLNAILCIALIVPQLAIAGGTLGTDQLSLLMGQMPEIRDFLRSSLRLSDSAFAEIRLGPDFINLSGARLGPYTIDAKSKIDGKPLIVVLCTRARFLDSKGRELPEARINQAASIAEDLTGVMLRQEDAVPARPQC